MRMGNGKESQDRRTGRLRDMIDLSTTYLGLSLKNPIVASASPLSKKVEHVKRLEEAGIAAL